MQRLPETVCIARSRSQGNPNGIKVSQCSSDSALSLVTKALWREKTRATLAVAGTPTNGVTVEISFVTLNIGSVDPEWPILHDRQLPLDRSIYPIVFGVDVMKMNYCPWTSSRRTKARRSVTGIDGILQSSTQGTGRRSADLRISSSANCQLVLEWININSIEAYEEESYVFANVHHLPAGPFSMEDTRLYAQYLAGGRPPYQFIYHSGALVDQCLQHPQLQLNMIRRLAMKLGEERSDLEANLKSRLSP
eukprot:5040283-Amphidinium_carterae.1